MIQSSLKAENLLSVGRLSEELRLEKNLKQISLAEDLNLKNLFEVVCGHACEFIGCDRATLFLVDERSEEIWSTVAHGTTEIRVPVGRG